MPDDQRETAIELAQGMLVDGGVVSSDLAAAEIAEYFARGRCPPKWARHWWLRRHWLAEAERRWPRKRRAGRDALGNRLRNECLVGCAHMLQQKFGMPATRNPASEHESACSIVAEAARRNGVDKLSEGAIAKVLQSKPLEQPVTLAAMQMELAALGVAAELSDEDVELHAELWGWRRAG